MLGPLPAGAEGVRLRVPRRCPGTEGLTLLQAGAPMSPLFQVPIPTTPELDPLSLLTDAADVATWSNQGLPSDRTSTENATILCNTQRWPLVVDAQLQGIKWIRNKYGERLKAIRLGQRRWAGVAGVAGVCLPELPISPLLPAHSYLDTIEQAVSEGHTLLIEDIGETVEPVLDHLLGRNTVKKGRWACRPVAAL